MSRFADRRRLLPVLVGVGLALSLSLLAGVLQHLAREKSRLEATSSVRIALGEARDEVDRRLATALAVPETLAAVVAAGERIDHRTFEAIASRLVRANPSIRNVALAPDNVITSVYPVKGNEAVIGLHYAQRPAQFGDVLRAMRTRHTIVAGPISLVQGGIGVVSRTPVFIGGADGRDTHYWGLVSLAVDADQLLVDISRVAKRNRVAIAVRRDEPGPLAATTFAGETSVFADSPVVMYYPLPGGARWQLAAVPQGGWETVQAMPPWLLFLPYLLSAVLGWAAYRVFASHEHHRSLASRDALTGLLNRKAFDHRLSAAVLQASPRSHALVLIDLDQFKPVNDTHGHSAGDFVLQQVAVRLRASAAHDDDVFRVGGDEFALLLRGARKEHELAQLAGSVADALAEPLELDGRRNVTVGASVGVAIFPLGSQLELARDVFDRADRALYHCKAQGGRRAHVEAVPATRPRVT